MNCMYHHMLKNCCGRQCKYFMCMFVCIRTCTFVDQPHTTNSPTYKYVHSCHTTLCCIHFLSSPITTMTIFDYAGDDTHSSNPPIMVEYFHQCFLQCMLKLYFQESNEWKKMTVQFIWLNAFRHWNYLLMDDL